MGVYVMTTNNGKGTISFKTGDDEYFNVGTGTKEAQSDEDYLTSLGMPYLDIQRLLNKIENVDKSLPVISGSVAVTVPVATYSSNLIKENQSANLLKAKELQLKELELKNNNEFQKATVELEKLKVKALTEQNSQLEYQLIMQSEIYGVLSEIATNVKNKAETKVNVSLNTDSLATANRSIADSLAIQSEHYDFMKNGSSNLKDSSGKTIIPREVEAKKNAEIHIEKDDMNRTTIDELLEFIPDLVGGALDEVGDLIGASDGFDLNFNPFEHVSKIYMDGMKAEIENAPPPAIK